MSEKLSHVEVTAYRREPDGTLTPVTILRDAQGRPCGRAGEPLEDTGEAVELHGWPHDRARVYLTAGGVALLVPEAVHSKPHVCCTCQRELDPDADAAVYLGWGERYDGQPGPGWVAALCAPTPEQVGSQTGSPCVAACRTWARGEGVQLVPSDYQGWLGAPVSEGGA
jgi:hypothetical protein